MSFITSSFKFIFFIFFLLGLTFVTINITSAYKKCPPKEVIYKYVPRTFKEEQNNPIPMKDLFGSMFSNPSPWVGSFNIN